MTWQQLLPIFDLALRWWQQAPRCEDCRARLTTPGTHICPDCVEARR